MLNFRDRSLRIISTVLEHLLKVALEKELTIRDLSEEKMKNASILGIQLPKFKGYNILPWIITHLMLSLKN